MNVGRMTMDGVEPRTCRCGHGRDHFMVGARGRYSLVGWFALLLGVTAEPQVVEYWCRRCGEKADETRDREVLKRHC
jgi:hypothetical protein